MAARGSLFGLPILHSAPPCLSYMPAYFVVVPKKCRPVMELFTQRLQSLWGHRGVALCGLRSKFGYLYPASFSGGLLERFFLILDAADQVHHATVRRGAQTKRVEPLQFRAILELGHSAACVPLSVNLRTYHATSGHRERALVLGQVSSRFLFTCLNKSLSEQVFLTQLLSALSVPSKAVLEKVQLAGGALQALPPVRCPSAGAA